MTLPAHRHFHIQRSVEHCPPPSYPEKSMKRLAALLCCLLLLLPAALAQQLVIGTYNVRLFVTSDEENGEIWATRCKVMCDQMNFEQPDAFGAQEVTHPQLVDMLAALDGYAVTGRARDDGKQQGEYSCIFYKKDRLQLLKEGTFWLSETPDKVSMGWDAACKRVCSWAKFRMKKGAFTFYHFNLHMDHIGVVARREAAKLVMKRIRSIAQGAPVVLTGDFNVDQNDEVYKTFSEGGLLNDCYTAARLRFAENGTYIAFDPDAKTDSRIDHIFVSPRFKVDNYGVLTNGYWTPTAASDSLQATDNGPAELRVSSWRRHTPSDHYPVIVKLHIGR